MFHCSLKHITASFKQHKENQSLISQNVILWRRKETIMCNCGITLTFLITAQPRLFLNQQPSTRELLSCRQALGRKGLRDGSLMNNVLFSVLEIILGSLDHCRSSVVLEAQKQLSEADRSLLQILDPSERPFTSDAAWFCWFSAGTVWFLHEAFKHKSLILRRQP